MLDAKFMDITYHVYVLANRPRGALYIGVTRDLVGRVQAHKEGHGGVHTRRYKLNQLVRFEGFGEPGLAIAREKALKTWKRVWKIRLIEKHNPNWRDLWFDLAR